MNDKLKYIADTLGVEEILIQLGEEASEVTHASLKLRRCINGKNPTPKSLDECMEDLLSEIVDVQVCLDALMELYPFEGFLNFKSNPSELKFRKILRWVKRLKENKN